MTKKNMTSAACGKKDSCFQYDDKGLRLTFYNVLFQNKAFQNINISAGWF